MAAWKYACMDSNSCLKMMLECKSNVAIMLCPIRHVWLIHIFVYFGQFVYTECYGM